jgi:hypothetical protein
VHYLVCSSSTPGSTVAATASLACFLCHFGSGYLGVYSVQHFGHTTRVYVRPNLPLVCHLRYIESLSRNRESRSRRVMDYLNWQFECGCEFYDGDRTGLPFYFVLFSAFYLNPLLIFTLLRVNLCLTFYLLSLIEFVVVFYFVLPAPIVSR